MEYELRIAGMHCTGCAQSVERYLQSEPGVTDATVVYDDGRGAVSVRPDTAIDDLVEGIERLGYDVTVLRSG